ncbi:uncharacterized protein L969DRAFT_21802 [Mixia osmundae IAM 14324]|uniref:DUF974-domain-containing protein n=1 Tax=Mixia osmundae (strain CBS 9802 / IAM 14324 / JCM 22182 / KY 12970) TaxID=764103 RepID=G7DXR9_MIXOS|nr:uncharacterized protein L969DRAFT_21802 [Mixia osmundae IAM 14324]KEI41134.1 hypothetical protein L969DRAFT_21802 [Mixia osmundae IAM 14324]GAA95379.1 hypothetical protein E5Q_02033 [Mixia osmundae IAM 14324]
MAESSMTEAHPLSVRVLRLLRPSAAKEDTIYIDKDAVDLLGARNSLLRQDVAQFCDFSAAPLLALSSVFGQIYLGETFNGYLAVHNDQDSPITGVNLKVEMQTAQNRWTLAETRSGLLKPRESLETVVRHELKEIGVHSLVCTVSYTVAEGSQQGFAPELGASQRVLKKSFKFSMSNPLSVKTKIHMAKSVTALLDKNQRETAYLELQIQNMTSAPLVFEQMRFEPSQGLTFVDANSSIFDNEAALLSPGDIRQYLYIVSPAVTPSPVFESGKVNGQMNLGRLNIVWRTPNGEGGKLQTSQLTRRMQAPAILSAPGSYAMHDEHAIAASKSATVVSPQSANSARKSDATEAKGPDVSGLTFDVSIELPVEPLTIHTPFQVRLSLRVRDRAGQRRVVVLALQHVRPVSLSSPADTTAAAGDKARQSVLLSEADPPASPAPPMRSRLAPASLLADLTSGAPSRRASADVSTPESLRRRSAQIDPYARDALLQAATSAAVVSHAGADIVLPAPEPINRRAGYTGSIEPSSTVIALGPSLIEVEPIELGNDETVIRVVELSYLPTETGLHHLGGLRVLALGITEEGQDVSEGRDAFIVRENSVLGEIYVQGRPPLRL